MYSYESDEFCDEIFLAQCLLLCVCEQQQWGKSLDKTHVIFFVKSHNF